MMARNCEWHCLRYNLVEWKLNMICKLKLQWQSHTYHNWWQRWQDLFFSTLPSPELFIQSLQFPVLCETLSLFLSLQQAFLSLVFAPPSQNLQVSSHQGISLYEIIIYYGMFHHIFFWDYFVPKYEVNSFRDWILISQGSHKNYLIASIVSNYPCLWATIKCFISNFSA